jgi:hypothetical protein
MSFLYSFFLPSVSLFSTFHPAEVLNSNFVPILFVVTYLILLLKVEFMPKFSVRGIWQRWRESYPVDGTKANGAITVFTGVSVVFIPSMYM